MSEEDEENSIPFLCYINDTDICNNGICDLDELSCNCHTGYTNNLIWANDHRCSFDTFYLSVWSILIIFLGVIAISIGSATFLQLSTQSKKSSLLEHELTLLNIAVSTMMILFGMFSLEDNKTTLITVASYSCLFYLLSGPLTQLITMRAIKPRLTIFTTEKINSYYVFKIWTAFATPLFLSFITLIYIWHLITYESSDRSIYGFIYVSVLNAILSISTLLAAYQSYKLSKHLDEFKGSGLKRSSKSKSDFQIVNIKKYAKQTSITLLSMCVISLSLPIFILVWSFVDINNTNVVSIFSMMQTLLLAISHLFFVTAGWVKLNNTSTNLSNFPNVCL